MKPAAWGALALVAGLLLGAALAEPRASSTEEGDALREASVVAASGAQRPTWRVGDAWRVQFDDNDPICWMVVVEATPDGYQQGVWCPTDEAETIALQIAATDARYLGRMTLDLGGRGDDEDTRWFDWPLAEGKTWATKWQGEEATVTAQLREGRFVMMLCLDEGDCVAGYDYDPELGWWSELEFDGGFLFRVHERDTGWREGAVYAVGTLRHEEDARNQLLVVAGPTVSFNVDEEESVVAVRVDWNGARTGSLMLEDSERNVVYSSTRVDDPEDVAFLASGVPGVWTLSHSGYASAGYRAWIRTIALHEMQPTE